MIYAKVNETLYPALSVNGRITDGEWDNRMSKSVTLTMTHGEAVALFTDGAAWSIVQDVVDGNGVATGQDEWDNSDYSVAGDVTDHRDGTVTVKMGRPTDLEEAYELLYGGDGA